MPLRAPGIDQLYYRSLFFYGRTADVVITGYALDSQFRLKKKTPPVFRELFRRTQPGLVVIFKPGRVISTKQRAGRGHVLHVFLLMVIDSRITAQSVPTVKNTNFQKLIENR